MLGTVVAVLLALPGFAENPRLSEVASYAAGEPVRVFCANDVDAWRAANASRVSIPEGFAPIGKRESYLAPWICQRLTPTKPKATPDFAAALLTLLHEARHAVGVPDESEADCSALRKLAEVAIVFYGFKSRSDKLRMVVRYAWYRHLGAPADYRRLC